MHQLRALGHDGRALRLVGCVDGLDFARSWASNAGSSMRASSSLLSVAVERLRLASAARERASTADSVSFISTRVERTRKAPSSTASTSEESTM